MWYQINYKGEWYESGNIDDYTEAFTKLREAMARVQQPSHLTMETTTNKFFRVTEDLEIKQ